MKDSNNENLNPNCIYKKVNNELVKVEDTCLLIDTVDTITTNKGEVNTLVYNLKNRIGTPKYQWDAYGKDDTCTILNYNNSSIVRYIK